MKQLSALLLAAVSLVSAGPTLMKRGSIPGIDGVL